MTNAPNGFPTWVLFLFFGVVYLGYLQSKTRKVSRTRIVVLPAIMVSLALYGVLTVPAHGVIAFVAWAIGAAAAVAMNSKVPHGNGVTLHEGQQHFVVPGSWIPLILMMSIFVVKSIIGYLIGSHSVNPEDVYFIAVSNWISGLISGTFLARALFIFKAGSAHGTTLLKQSGSTI